jgi:uracil-DNA glycosylase
MLTLPTKPSPHRICILGEAPGEEETLAGQPFVGASGKLLRTDLFPAAGLDIDTCHITNVFQERPPNNDIKAWTATKTDLKKLKLPIREPALDKRYLLSQYWTQVEATQAYLLKEKFDLIICLGGKALWACTGDSRIGTFRGSFMQSPYGTVLATYHPAAVLREWSFRPFVWADLTKARKFLEGTLVPPLRRRMYVNPTWAEIAAVYKTFADNPSWLIGVDIETAPSIDQITVVGFATESLGICIPFWSKHSGQTVYETAADELRAWRWVQKFAALSNPKAMQNGMYDMQYLLDAPIPILARNNIHDTAILQHALQPELRKDLGTLASLYLNEPSWKQLRKEAKGEKKDD